MNIKFDPAAMELDIVLCSLSAAKKEVWVFERLPPDARGDGGKQHLLTLVIDDFDGVSLKFPPAAADYLEGHAANYMNKKIPMPLAALTIFSKDEEVEALVKDFVGQSFAAIHKRFAVTEAANDGFILFKRKLKQASLPENLDGKYVIVASRFEALRPTNANAELYPVAQP